MSNDKNVLILGCSTAFLSGALIALLGTGSINTHWGLEEIDNYQLPSLEERQDKSVVTTQPSAIEQKGSITTGAHKAQNDFAGLLEKDFENLKIIKDGVTGDEARLQLFDAYSTTPSIVNGNGSKQIYVLFDVLCPHCHTLYKTFTPEYLAKHDLTVHWVPTVAFLDQPASSVIAQKLTTALLDGQTELADKALTLFMRNGDPSILKAPEWTISPEAIMQVGKNTIGLLQAGTGTPTVIFQKEDGSIDLIDGIPDETDYLKASKKQG